MDINSNASGAVETQSLASLTLAADGSEELHRTRYSWRSPSDTKLVGFGFGLDDVRNGQIIRRRGVSGSVIVTNHYWGHLKAEEICKARARPEAIQV
jgi:hypothetical protein